jgi:hypothetical protein
MKGSYFECALALNDARIKVEQYRKLLLTELRRQQWGDDAIDEMLQEAGLPLLGQGPCKVCGEIQYHRGSCADQNALLDYPYGKYPVEQDSR